MMNVTVELGPNITANETTVFNSTEAAPTGTGTGVDITQMGLYVAAMELQRVKTFIIAGIGLPSNLASLITLLKMRPMTSSVVFLAVLAVIDLSFLFWDTFFIVAILYLKLYMSPETCRLYVYLGSIMMHSSIWLMVAVTAERVMAVWLPLKVANLCTVRRATYTSAAILIALAALNIPYTFTATNVQIPSGHWYCMNDPKYLDLMSKWTYVDSAIYVLIPWPILAICNGMIIFGLRMSAKRKQRLTNSTSKGGANDHTFSITIMLVTASVVCFVLISPNFIYYLYHNTQAVDVSQASAEYVATRIFTQNIIFFFSTMNHAINFWIYVISGSRFRQVFFDLLKCQDPNKAKKYIKQSKTTGVSQVTVSQKLPETETNNDRRA